MHMHTQSTHIMGCGASKKPSEPLPQAAAGEQKDPRPEPQKAPGPGEQKDGGTGEQKDGGQDTVLRIIAVNDVYLLDNMPRLKTLIDAEKAKPGTVLVTLAGDFLGPSMLSSLDQGSAMIAVLNRLPVDLGVFR